MSLFYIRHGITPWQYNILTQGTEGGDVPAPDIMKGVGTMVTYSDLFTFVIMLCTVVTLVLTITKRKK